MHRWKMRDAWNHTATLCAVIVNSAPFRKGKPKTPNDFNPYAAKPTVGIEVLKVFLPKNG